MTFAISCPVITVAPTTLAQGTVGAAYSQTITASGGSSSYVFAITSGTLPAGLTLNSSTGVISGTPTTSNAAGTSITVSATDSFNCSGTKTYTLQICPVVTLSPTTLPTPTVGTAYSQTITASGGATPYTYTLASGTLPTWATLSSAGVLSGTPNSTAAATFTVRATDVNGCAGTFSYTITPVCPAITIGQSSLPQGTVGTAYSQTITASGGIAPYSSWTVTAGTLPAGLTLNASTGVISGTPTASASPATTITVRVNDANGCQGSRAITLQICPIVTLSPATLPTPTVGTAYSQTITAAGGATPYTYTLASGTLPTWATLSSAGVLSGTPINTTSATFTVRATDVNGCAGTLSYTIAPLCPTITIAQSSLPQGTVGTAYSQTITASGGVAPYSAWTVTAGTLPAGLTLNASTGVISGTPTASASPATTITVQVNDTNGCQGSRAITLQICPVVTLSPTTLPTPTVGTAYSQTVTASGGATPYVFAVASGTLPAGLTLNTSTGVISGTPTSTTAATFTIRSTDANGCAATLNQTLTPVCPVISITPTAASTGTMGSAYSQTLTAAGGSTPYSAWTVTAGTLPAGLTLNASTGVISGTPTASNGAGVSFTVRVSDTYGCQGTQVITLKICPVITMAPATLPTPSVGTAYSQTITASGGATPYTYTLASGTLPTWATLSSAGVLSGTPTTTTSASFTVRATDANGCTATLACAITPVCPTVTIGQFSLPQGLVGTAYSQTLTASGGVAPYGSWTITSGAMPTGLTLNAGTGVISGTPSVTASPATTITVRVNDANGCQGTRSLTLQVCPVVTLAPSTLATPTIGLAYSQTVAASGGSTPYTYTVSSGALPSGLALNASTGVISGTPTSAAAASFTITGTDANGCAGSQAYTLTTISTEYGDNPSFAMASQTASPGIYVGTNTTDADSANPSSGTANTDDTTGNDDEDLVMPVVIPNIATSPIATPNTVASPTITIPVTLTGITSGRIGVWIDWDGDGLVTGTNETVGLSTANLVAGVNTITATLVPPLTVTPGTVYLRIRVTEGTTTPTFSGTSSLQGEVEDYAVQVRSPLVQFNMNLKNNAGYPGAYTDVPASFVASNVTMGAAYPSLFGYDLNPNVLYLSTPSPGVSPNGIYVSDDPSGPNGPLYPNALEYQSLSLRCASNWNINFNNALTATRTSLTPILNTAPFLFTVGAISSGSIDGFALDVARKINSASPNKVQVFLTWHEGTAYRTAWTSSATLANTYWDGSTLTGPGSLFDSSLWQTVLFDGSTGGAALPTGVALANTTFLCEVYFTGTSTAGVVELDNLTLLGSTVSATTDFGDWNGAGAATTTTSSIVNNNLRLGATVDVEGSVTPNAAATTDDLTGVDDEDGITLPLSITQATSVTLPVSVFNNTGASAYLNAWIDFNNDGTFDNALLSSGGERLEAARTIASSASTTTQNITFTVPASASAGTQRGLRLRLTNQAVTPPIGTAGSGEIEDHAITIVCSTITLAPTTIPVPTVGTAYSQTITASGGGGPYTFAVSSGALPAGLTLNAASGVISGTPASSAAATFTVRATDANGCSGTQSYTVTPVCTVLSISPTTGIVGTAGSAYSQTLTATGGTAPYASWTVTSGTLPAGLTLNASTGVISGTPTASNGAGVTVTVRATDTYGCQGTGTISIKICPAITLSPTSLANSSTGFAYSQTITATGGATPYVFAVSSGTLPAGLTLNTSSGLISGTPTSTTMSIFTIRVTDANGCTGTRNFTVTPTCGTITLSPATLPNGVANTAYSQTVTSTGGTGTIVYSITTGALPAGLSLNTSTGAITGTPTSTAAASFTVRATDSIGCTGSQSYTVTPACQTITLSPTTLPNGTVNTAYSQTITSSNGIGTITWSISAGTLPAGLSLNASTGAITGTPTSTAAGTFTVRATDANGCTATQSYTVTPACPVISVTPATLTAGVVGTAYSQTLTASGGIAPYTAWTVTSGTLPAGLSLNASTGVISGTPTTSNGAGVSVTIRAADANGCTGSAAVLIKICPVITLAPTTPATPVVGVAYSQNITASGGVSPYTFTLASGALPAGMSLSSSGGITGTTTSTTAATFTVRATASDGCTGTQSYTLTPACPTLSITPSSLPPAYLGSSYSQTLTGSGGTAPYTFALQSGALPNGLSFTSAGLISGTPTATGTFNFVVRATDANACVQTFNLSLQVRTLSIGNLVFEDSNNNGVRDAGEPGMAGARVQLFSAGSDNAIGGTAGAADTQVGSDVVTPAGGAYLFAGLSPGTYYLKVTPPYALLRTSGTPATTDNNTDNNNDGSQPGGAGTDLFSPVVTLTGGGESITDGDTDADTNLTLDFGLWAPMAVGNFIFLDINGDGRRNEGESLGNIYVELYASGTTPGVDSPVSVGTSGCSCKGRYYLDNLNPGDYFLYIPPSQFATGAALEGLLPMSGVVTGDDDVGQDLTFNNNPAVNGASTAVFSLRAGQAPTGSAESGGEGSIDDAIDNLVDLTRDLGVVAPAGTGFASAERIRRNIVTGGFVASVLPGATTFATWDQSGNLGGPTDDPDEDGLPNLLEYALGLDPADPLQAPRFALGHDSAGVISASITQLIATHDDIVVSLETLTDLTKAADASAWKRLSMAATTTFNGDGTLTRQYANLEKLLVFKGLDTGFIRLRVDLDANRDGTAESTVTSSIHAWSRQSFATGSRTFSMPLLQPAVFTGSVSSVSGNEIVLPYILTLPSGSLYLEAVDGTLAGQRFEIDSAASSGNTVTLQGSSQSLSGLTDAHVVIRPHHTLAGLLDPAVFGSDDRVLFFSTAANNFATLTNDGTEWLNNVLSMNARPFAAHEAALVQIRGTGATLMFTGEVRANAFVTPHTTGTQLIGPGWPLSQAAPVTGLRSGATPETADRLRIWNGDTTEGASDYTSYYLDNSTVTPSWKSQTGDAAPAAQQNAFHGLFLIREAATLLKQQVPW